jgi:hypothetical protein
MPNINASMGACFTIDNMPNAISRVDKTTFTNTSVKSICPYISTSTDNVGRLPEYAKLDNRL